MKTIDTNTIGKTIEGYMPGYKNLIRAEVEYPIARGVFEIKKTPYWFCDLGYLPATLTPHCLNQLGYVFFSEVLKENQFKEFSGIDFERYKTQPDLNLFILIETSYFSK